MQFKIINGSFGYNYETILENIEFEIKPKDKIAICGRNGCGKTTLLKIISGEENLNTNIDDKNQGQIIKADVNSIGYLKQMVFEDEQITMIDEVLKVFKDLLDLQDRINKIQLLLQNNPSDKLINEFTKLNEKFDMLGGNYYQKEYNSMLKAFGFSESDKQKKLCEFSGGQKTKIAFVKLLLSKPDILLLDEPTNHLDITAIEWLENYLMQYQKAVVCVSHDRAFLDKVVNVVYEIERKNAVRYVGNYSDFVITKQENYINQLKDYNIQQREIKRLNAIIEKFRYKKNKAKMAQSKIKYLDRMDKIESPEKSENSTFHFKLNVDLQSGKEVLTIKDLLIGYDKVLSKISLKIMRGQKVGIVGANGIGKSTFLETIAGKINSLGGEYKFGHNVNVGYFKQQNSVSDNEKTVFDDYFDEFPKLNQTQVRHDLGCFLFTDEDVFKKVKDLSGGERVRLNLLKIFKTNPNFLLLDEPTNHMDIIGKETLENILQDYEGTILTVSHDRYFLNKICDRILVFMEDGNIKEFDSFEDYENSKNVPVLDNKIKEEITKPLTDNQVAFLENKEKARRKRMRENTELKIGKLEEEIANLKLDSEKPEFYENMDKYLPLMDLISVKENELLQLYNKWEELCD